MKNFKDFVTVLLLLCLIFKFSTSIYVPENQQYQSKPAYTSGIKTSSYVRPAETLQLHHNYSKVYHQNNNYGYSKNELDREELEPNERPYPVYNAHTYGNRPSSRSERFSNQVYVLNGTRIKKTENPIRRIVLFNKEKRTPKIQIYKTCPYNATGQFVYESSCNQFLNCWKGRGYVQNCSPGTLFNPKTLECDFPAKVDCITGPRQNTLQNEKSSSLTVKQIGCPKEFSGLIPNYTDCSKFINCVSGIENFMDCPAGTLFDIDKNICDFAHKAKCFNGENEKLKEQSVNGRLDFESSNCKSSTCSKTKHQLSYRNKNEVKCPDYAEGLYKHPTDCSKFLNCANGQTHIQDCAPGTLFNPSIKICDFPYNVRCQNDGDSSGHQSKTWQHTGHSGTNVPAYIPSNTYGEGSFNHLGGHSNTWGENIDYETTTYGSYNRDYGVSTSSTRHYNNNRGTTSYTNNRNTWRQDHDSQENTGSRYYNQNTGIYEPNRGSFDVPTYHRTTPHTNNYNAYHDSTAKTYQQPTRGCVGSDCQENNNYSFDNNYNRQDSQNTYSNSQYDRGQIYGQTTASDLNTNNRNNWGHNHNSYDDWGQRPSGTYDNWNRNAYPEYNRPINQYEDNGNWNQPHYNIDSTNSEHTYGYNHLGTNKYPSGSSNYYYNNRDYSQNFGTERQRPLYGGYNTSNTGITYGQNNLGINRYNTGQNYNRSYHQNFSNHRQGGLDNLGVNRYDDTDQSYYNRGYNQNVGNHRQDGLLERPIYGGYNSSRYYGQNNMGMINYDRGSSNYNQGTSGQSTWPLNNYQPDLSMYNRNDQQEYTKGTTIKQRGENGYPRIHGQHTLDNRNEWYDQNRNTGNWNHEPITPNYHHVVNINHVKVTTPVPFRKPYEPFYGTTARSSGSSSRSIDYDDTFDGSHPTKPMISGTTPRILEKNWPPPFPSTDVNADYVFEYDDNQPVILEAENAITDEQKRKGECGKSEYRCSVDTCISKTLICNGVKDCSNGNDELKCLEYMSKFSVKKEHKLAILEKERWDNVSIATCALLCIETRKFQCRSFNYRKVDKTCFLTDTNEGLTGALIAYYPFDYYELISEKLDCSKMYVCPNKKCIERRRICDGKDDCGDRIDEKGCKPEDFNYSIRLTGSKERNQGQIEVTAFDKTGYVCDDNFGMRDADVVCKELGFHLGAAEVKKNAFFTKNTTLIKDPFFIMDDVNCLGNETRLMDCDFSGWGVHNCLGQEIAGVVCKTQQKKCPEDYWQCDTNQECLPLAFVCDGLLDCTDGSDEKKQHCDSATEIRLVNGSSRQEGRVEIKHHGIWGTICDDDFNEDAAKVICRHLGYKGSAAVKKEAFFGRGSGPIWLDQVFCSGNESDIESCTHWEWGEHNCEHSEDVGVICSNIYEHERHSVMPMPKIPQTYPFRCGYRKDNMFNADDDVHFRVVRGSLAKKGDYPWQAAIRVKGKSNKEIINHWCGAVVISEKFVLTAAHCLVGYSKGAYVVVAGDYDVDNNEGTEQEAYIEDYYIHEEFRKGHKMNNDIALVKLKGRGFRLNDDVQAICLPENNTNYETNLNCTISGFGSIQSGKSAFSHQLRAGWIPIQKKEICKMPHVYGEAMTEGMICAGSLDEGIDSCDGDSGGPLACLKDGVFTLYGITSWGQHCGYANKPGVYVKVAHYRKWIDDNFHKYS